MRDIYKKSKTVSEALDTRLTCRAFKSTEIKKEVIFDILDKARRAPSGGNLQPWRVWVVSGDPLKSFKEEIQIKASKNPRGEGTEYKIYPPNLKDPYEKRRKDVGEGMYKAINVSRDDKVGRIKQFMKNFEFFDAPVALITPLISTSPPLVVIWVFEAPASKIVFISTLKVPLDEVIFAFRTVVVASKVNVESLEPV